MLQFEIDQAKCTRCGLCAADCPVRIIRLEGGYPVIMDEKADACLGCQHCLAICPTAALSILGCRPEQSRSLHGNVPAPEQLETLIRGRRSVRSYRNENLAPELMQQLLDIAWQAPTGLNQRSVRFHVIDDRQTMETFRIAAYDGLSKRIEAGTLPQNHLNFTSFVRLWHQKGVDILFRGAPHLVVATAPHSAATPREDCLIALSFFDLYAQSQKVGTLWSDLVYWAIADLVPELQVRLSVPADHLVGCAMIFGPPAVLYQRTVDHGAAKVVRYQQ